MENNKMMKILIDENLEINRTILIIIIGLMESLSKSAITVEDAEGAIFTPYSYVVLKELGVSNELLNLVKDGTELEDVEALVPEQLSNNCEKIKNEAINLLKKLPKRVSHYYWLSVDKEQTEKAFFDEPDIKKTFNREPEKKKVTASETENSSQIDAEELKEFRKWKSNKMN
ncbi:DUF3969 family protein [Lactococcus nasutitermitis]|uniref:DUF3969 family protein n=1 Tax=Lactococcus nasutitermitis TaxID=1652957 RepID=A0ABV9JBR1_9LACT|nr:DUF3969 family protein [Lactococcus nasutitermitis]